MEEREKRRPIFYTGGKGGMPSSVGEANQWWVNPALTSVPRLILMTHLAVNGRTAMADLARMLPTELANLHPLVKAMARSLLLETWMEKTRIPGRYACGQMKSVRMVGITAYGRRELWRYGWVTRRVLFSPWYDLPLRKDVPRDPIAAIRDCVRMEFLRPAELALVFQLALFGTTSLQGLYAFTGNPALTFFHLRKWRDAGLAGRRGRELPYRRMNDEGAWDLTAAGRLALERHVDAMRRVCAASGYRDLRECDIYHPNEWYSPCAMSISAENPAKCEDCVFGG